MCFTTAQVLGDASYLHVMSATASVEMRQHLKLRMNLERMRRFCHVVMARDENEPYCKFLQGRSLNRFMFVCAPETRIMLLQKHLLRAQPPDYRSSTPWP